MVYGRIQFAPGVGVKGSGPEKGRAALLLWGIVAEPPRVEGLNNTYGVLWLK